MKKIVIAGNPNSGKTCLFNQLTGNIQRVGNYPGVTVEFTIGSTKIKNEKVDIVDLPGTYSLTAYSQEEVVARNYIVDEQPDLILNVIDASNLERNLYLTAQLIELNMPMVIALNMVDVAEKKGIQIDAELLGKLLGVKVIETVGNKRRGLETLKNSCIETIETGTRPKPLSYSHEMRQVLPDLEKEIEKHPEINGIFSTRWGAVKLLEDDEIVVNRMKHYDNSGDINNALSKAKGWLRHHSGEESSTAVVEARYGFASGAAREVTLMSEVNRRMLTDVIDRLVCNRILGPVILCLVVYALFLFVFKCADELQWVWLPNGNWYSPTELFNLFFDEMSGLSENIATPWLQSLIKDGIIGGVGGVMSFVPLIFFMFLFIAVLEDSGYIARVAFIMDRVLRIFGMQGKSVLSLIVSGGLGAGGCAVPGVMAARTLREDKDRLITIMVSPFMNCGAKLPVYAMLIAAFFAKSRGAMMFLLWLLSWAFALSSAWMLRKWVIKGEQTPFVMELPVYHLPTFRGILMDTWNRTWMYIRKAATIILGISIIMWVLMYYPRHESPELQAKLNAATNPAQTEQVQAQIANAQLKNSWAGRLGTSIESVSKYAGFSWRENIALIGGLAAKEVVLGTMGTAYSMGKIEADASEPLSTYLSKSPDWNRLRGFALLLFVMGYAPCLATLAAIKKETGSWKWTTFSAVYSTAFAFIICVVVYQIGQIFM